MNAKHIERLLLLSGTLLLPACAVGPDYERPPVETPVTFKEQPKELSAEWKQAVPQDTADRGRVVENFQRSETRCVGTAGRDFKPEYQTNGSGLYGFSFCR